VCCLDVFRCFCEFQGVVSGIKTRLNLIRAEYTQSNNIIPRITRREIIHLFSK
jgi:hypothetical protein